MEKDQIAEQRVKDLNNMCYQENQKFVAQNNITLESTLQNKARMERAAEYDKE